MYARGMAFLATQQHENGGFGQIPGSDEQGEVGITGLVVQAMANAPEAVRAEHADTIEAAVEYLLAHQQEDGSFTQGRSGLGTYRTGIAVMALSAVDRERFAEDIQRAAEWLKTDQFDEEEGVDETSPHYGGFGYDHAGESADCDMSNTQIALTALHEAGLSEDDPVYQRAITFLERCQNRSESNPGVGGLRPMDDGGFIYDPGLSRNKSDATEHEDGTVSFDSYASITYAGLMSMIYTGLSEDDPRVEAALGWIFNNYTLEENRGLGLRSDDAAAAQQGLFYYYLTFAKALSALGQETIETASGPRTWAADLAEALRARQNEDGSWTNPNDRWWEQDPVLVTAYSLNALNYARAYQPE